MYLGKIVDENIGPIEKLAIEFPFTIDGCPKPVILVGENGSGKSTALSNIVDAFYTIASNNYDDAMREAESGVGKQYYKAISPTEIRLGKTLQSICAEFAKIPHEKKYIFIADRDSEDINKKFSSPDGKYKDWGNNIYSFLIPIPSFRCDTPNICIEHLYTDDEIKTEVEIEGERRRLFIGNEFDSRGIASSIDRYCENRNKCGPDSIDIIEGSKKEKVTSISCDNGVNYALSKMNFAEYVDKHRSDFKFDSFLDLFKTIRRIIKGEEEVN